MGYYTDYSLSAQWRGDGEVSEEKIKALNAEVKKMNIFDGYDGYGGYNSGWFVSAKWYDWEDDMLLLSSRFPEFLFTMEGHGEDSDDMWLEYFLGGQVQRGGLEIIRMPFEIHKLTAEPIDWDCYSHEEDEE